MPAQAAAVVAYYEATRRDFRWLWTGRQDMAVHFGHYDDRARGHRRALLRMNEVLAELSGVQAQDTVLDAGCGLGGSATWLARQIGCQVTGITLVPFQAAEGMRRVHRLGLGAKVGLMRADYAHLPFADASFSLYWALESLVHAPDRATVFAEARRVLRPGGRLILTDCFARQSPVLSSRERDELRPGLEAWAMPALIPPHEYGSLLSRAGFVDVEHRDITQAIRPSVRRLARLCHLALPGARLLHRLGLFDSRRLQNITGALIQGQALARGLWTYGIISARLP